MKLIDGHLDLAMNAMVYNRDLSKSARHIREDEAGMTGKGRGRNTIGFPDLRAADTVLSFVTCLGRVKAVDESSRIDYRTHEQAFAHAQAEFAWYREHERQGVLRVVEDEVGLNHHLESWDRDADSTPLGVVLTMEGADPIVSPDRVHAWWDQGLRVLSLAHYGPSKYASGTASEGPVTTDGLSLLDEMSQTAMILDVTHLCDESFWIAIDRFAGPLIATHSNCRALVPGDRQFSDDQLKALIERDVVIGAALDAWMLQPNWERGTTTPENLKLESVVDQIDHVCQLAGNANHAAMGTDLDGGYGTEQTPGDFDTYEDMQRIPDLLRNRGYAESDIEAIFHGNWVRKLRSVWSVNPEGSWNQPNLPSTDQES